ncbi:hypothetical protein [Streptomyces sp. H27-D2]|uniref:hypothetical protein n=1 Tax=Streptomyces sp. H27-D2 TaxID=3046304 RepID=UPI002DBE0D75|nr:hypothetical protein [Streptomyces sp. H27-D2]MEC4016015.1 hypothetical protein [Streptomyces sp. H27-D2]
MTAPQLMVQIDGQTLPLTDCVWVEFAPCGCPCQALHAAYDNSAHATEEQARAEFNINRQGYRLELMTFAQYHADLGLTAKRLRTKADTTQAVIPGV